MTYEEMLSHLEKISNNLQADVLIYSGKIESVGFDRLVEMTKEPTKENVLLILCTPGGDAHSAFRIARRLQEKYAHFYLYVYGYCKSAGTLIAIGSDSIIMSDYAEFGPLDVQLQEKDELWKFNSGLNVSEATRTLRFETIAFFRHTLIGLVAGDGISTKTAAQLATKLAIAFVTPVLSKIDPVRLGETERAIKIASAYGQRLICDRGNLSSPEKLALLVQEYPDHGFVIDFKEAESIFKSVRKSDDDEEKMGIHLKEIIRRPAADVIIRKIYPMETKDEQTDKSGIIERNREDQGKTRQRNSGNSGKVVKTEPREESIV